MKKWKHIVFFCAVFFITASASAQELKVTFPRAKSFKEEQIAYKKARTEERQQRQYSREERKAVKAYHKKLQTKAVRKRMKQNRKKAERNHFNKKEPRILRWFGR